MRSTLNTGVNGTVGTMRTSRGYLCLPNLSLGEVDQLVGRGLVAGVQLDERSDLLASDLVRLADYARDRDGRVLQRHVLDVAGIDVETSSDDEVLLPIEDVEVAVLVEATDVARVEPALPHRRPHPATPSSRA